MFEMVKLVDMPWESEMSMNGLQNFRPSSKVTTPPVEPDILSRMDDWDLDFERLTGTLPTFSRLYRPPMELCDPVTVKTFGGADQVVFTGTRPRRSLRPNLRPIF